MIVIILRQCLLQIILFHHRIAIAGALRVDPWILPGGKAILGVDKIPGTGRGDRAALSGSGDLVTIPWNSPWLIAWNSMESMAGSLKKSPFFC